MPRPSAAAAAALALLHLRLVLLLALLEHPAPASAELALRACNLTQSDRRALALQVVDMFDHAYGSYLSHAHPADELRPLSCAPVQSFGGLSVTLIDSLDTLIVLRQWARFAHAVKHVIDRISFAVDENVSVFETNIRVLGGLLSAHGLLTEGMDDTGFEPHVWCPWYHGQLLTLATDLADRLMPAFNTPTAIPYGSINLALGVLPDESQVASTAGAGSLLLEFGTLSRLTRDPRYYRAAFRAMQGLHERAAERTGLVGNHINIMTGEWVATEAGVGGLVDSFYEYMYKGYILFGDERLLSMFRESNASIKQYLHKRPWYLGADMWSGRTSSLSYSSLSAFWPGVQVLFGDFEEASETTRAHYSVWRRYGCLPEGYHVVDERPTQGQINYPLRPELVESVFYLHWATNDSMWLGVARGMMHALEKVARVKCGYAAVSDVSTHKMEDLMPSFLLSETLKYLYLVFTSEGVDGKPHWARSGRYVFTTEAHPLRIPSEAAREFLGLEADEKTGGARRKCKRGNDRLQQALPCGFGLGGSDFPSLSAGAFLPGVTGNGITQEIADSVSRQVRVRAKSEGKGGVTVGDVVFGDGWACRIVSVHGTTVSYERLGEVEAALERLRSGGLAAAAAAARRSIALRRRCRRVRGADVVGRGVGVERCGWGSGRERGRAVL